MILLFFMHLVDHRLLGKKISRSSRNSTEWLATTDVVGMLIKALYACNA